MNVECIIEADGWAETPLSQLAEQAIVATLTYLEQDPGQYEIAVLACDDARISELNHDFRQKGQATNVLSWPSEERGAAQEGGTPLAPTDQELGDIAIAYETCHREAREQGKPLEAHVQHLLVHATLHLLGYDHERDGDATLMEGLEVEILGKLGLSDPYC